MAYIIKNTSGLLNTRFTDTGRLKLSKGKLDITYFQVGDSEISYSAIPNYNQTKNFILEPAYNAQNSTQEPELNKMNIKYPFYVSKISGGTYGLATEDSQVYPVYNTAATRGFFSGSQYNWSAQTSSAYTISSNYIIDTCLCNGNNIVLNDDFCSTTTGTPSVGDYATIYYDGVGGCGNITGNFPILTYKIQEVNGNLITLDRDIPNFTGAVPPCYKYEISNTTSPTRGFGYTDCYGVELTGYISGFSTMEICSSTVPNNTELQIVNTEILCPGCCGNARVLIYPSGMTALYDTNTPQGYWPPDVINFESICDLGNTDVKIWNMNIPWSTSPAGVISTLNEDYTNYASAPYLGSKEYFGYQETSGQTFYVNASLTAETTDTFYYNSYDEIIDLYPNEQKAIAIVHYTNNAIDSFYGEKFALNPYDINAIDQTGFARNFKITLPWLMWHKSTTGNMGETFYVDPNVGTADYFQVKYMKSSKNSDMNNPGLRYYHLWDTNLNSDGNPNRVGKVFPDLKTIVFDDEEIIAALSYKSNRNWTLPAPSVSLITPNVCDANQDDYGVLGSEKEYMYITYRFDSTGLTDSLHCNYYTKIQGPNESCNLLRQNVAVRFGNEFPFMDNGCCYQGFNSTNFQILAQKVTGDTTQPLPGNWKIIDFTDQLSGNTIDGYIPPSAMTNNTFVITYNQYTGATTYNLNDYIPLPLPTGETNKLNFGDEYYFYGNIETDIEATIYEMRFLCNLASTQFTNSSNPTWTAGTKNYITEVGLFDSNKDLIVITKLQAPILRQGTQQFAVKLDF
jgi:hypothetical protein